MFENPLSTKRGVTKSAQLWVHFVNPSDSDSDGGADQLEHPSTGECVRDDSCVPGRVSAAQAA